MPGTAGCAKKSCDQSVFNRLMNYTLRPAEESDYEFVYQLKVVCLKDYVSATWGWDEDFQRSFFADHFEPNDIQIIQFESLDIGQLSVEDRVNCLFLAGVYLLPAFQGRGIGSAIINDVLSCARTRHLPVCLRVLKVNPARNLYERLGFELIRENETHYNMKYQS